MMRYVTEAEVTSALTMPLALAAMRRAFTALSEGRARNLPRRRVRAHGPSLAVMAAATDDDGGFLAAKLYTAGPHGARFHVAVWRAEDGEMVALLEAERLGCLRTGAASGLAADLLSRPEAESLAVIGSGLQAFYQVEAVCHVRPMRRIRVYSRSTEHRERFARDLRDRLDVPADPVSSGEDAVRGADVVVTITASQRAVLQGAWLSPGTCVLAAGSNHPQHREVDEEVIRKAGLLVVDDREVAKLECGDLLPHMGKDRQWAEVVDLADVLAGRSDRRTTGSQIVLFESQGMAVEDLYAALTVLKDVPADCDRQFGP